jgi:hypothetical protein
MARVEFTYEFEGVERRGSYGLLSRGKLMTVSTEFGSRGVQVWNRPVQALARQIALEIAGDHAAVRARQDETSGA